MGSFDWVSDDILLVSSSSLGVVATEFLVFGCLCNQGVNWFFC